MVTWPLPIFKSKGKYHMVEKPSHVEKVSLSYVVDIGLRWWGVALTHMSAEATEEFSFSVH
jgi:hypothetical protein